MNKKYLKSISKYFKRIKNKNIIILHVILTTAMFGLVWSPTKKCGNPETSSKKRNKNKKNMDNFVKPIVLWQRHMAILDIFDVSMCCEFVLWKVSQSNIVALPNLKKLSRFFIFVSFLLYISACCVFSGRLSYNTTIHLIKPYVIYNISNGCISSTSKGETKKNR